MPGGPILSQKSWAEPKASELKSLVADDDERNREPSVGQKTLMFAYQILSLVAFTIVIPTSRTFTQKLGGDELFSPRFFPAGSTPTCS